MGAEPRGAPARLRAWLATPVDAAGLYWFRRMFGALLLFSALRYMAMGWVDEILVEPPCHFTWLGFGWVRPPGRVGTWLVFGLLAATALGLMLHWRPRLMAGVHGLLFTAVELMEKAAYLNHYYLMSLLCGLLAMLPAADGSAAQPQVGRWVYGVLRVQVGLVYCWAGVAKLNPDWLLEAQPLRLWLAPFAHVPLVGPLLAHPLGAHAMSIGGAVFDLTIPLWLSRARTRAWAYGAAVGFHVTVWLLFPIGVFPWVMLAAATVFFDPAWPRRWWGRGSPVEAAPIEPAGRARAIVLGTWLAAQALLPLRPALYPGWSAFTEAGFDFSWRVMLVEKTGWVELRVVAPTLPRARRVRPEHRLTPLQARMASFRPDLIVQLAQQVAAEYRAAGHPEVAVYADAFVSLNGRPAARLIDPAVDLSRVRRGLGADAWVLPAPTAATAPR